jgi:hypothetical protein
LRQAGESKFGFGERWVKVGEANANETKTNAARPSFAEKGFQDWIKSIFDG